MVSFKQARPSGIAHLSLRAFLLPTRQSFARLLDGREEKNVIKCHVMALKRCWVCSFISHLRRKERLTGETLDDVSKQREPEIEHKPTNVSTSFNMFLLLLKKGLSAKEFFQVPPRSNKENTYAMTLSGLCHLICVGTMNHTEPSIDLLQCV